jgi:hypothetical protein
MKLMKLMKLPIALPALLAALAGFSAVQAQVTLPLSADNVRKFWSVLPALAPAHDCANTPLLARSSHRHPITNRSPARSPVG